jgi:PPOX class probable F420-dependent enzyme
VEAEHARQFVRQNPRAVLATLRRDGRPQLTPVLVGIDEAGRPEISTSEVTAKVRNLRRDPRASLCMLTESFFGESVQIHGTAEIVSLPQAMEPLVEYYRRLAGEHPDWDEYRDAMKREQRCLIKISIEEAVP